MNKLVALKGYEPFLGSELAGCYDVKSRGEHIIKPGEVKLIPTGIKVAMDKGYVCKVYPRSSLPLKKGLMLANSVGIVDADYRGEIHIQLYNLNDYEVVIEDKERIGQIAFEKYYNDFKQYSEDLYDKRETAFPSQRGAGGFGSTGN